MKSRFWLILLFSTLGAALRAAPAEPAAGGIDRTAAEFDRRLVAATEELTATRQRIAREGAPIMESTRTAQERIAALHEEIAQLQAQHGEADVKRQHLERDGQSLQRNSSYLAALGRDTAKLLNDGIMPGEPPDSASRLADLAAEFESGAAGADVSGATGAVEFALVRLRRQLGGSAAPGQALDALTNRPENGTFIYFGPEVFFVNTAATVAGTVRAREGSPLPVVYPVPGWKAEAARAIATGQRGLIPADPSGGRALQLRQTTGTLFEHINRGGPVAYLIIVVGLFAAILAGHKALELRRLDVGSPGAVSAVLRGLFDCPPGTARESLGRLAPTTREMFTLGLRHAGQAREVLEEHLFAFTMRQRLQFERRLPLLAVIATASPLMGLLGTVMGMIKTFALITVFGTGNAAKLSSGISEVLVTTELGLTVAIPALVLHGFLSHRTQRKLSLLERYAVEFVAAAGEAKRPVASSA